MTRNVKTTAPSAVVAAALLVANPTSANGRFPRSQKLVEDPRDPAHLYLAGTYGLLRTTNRGKDWDFVCEQAFAGNSLYAGDPLLAFAGDGSLLVDVQVSLNVSHDDGCSWAPALGGGTNRVVDFTVAPSSPTTALAIVANYEARVVHRLYESTDQGKTWSPIGVPLPLDAVFTVDVAPQDPGHVYATGLASQAGQLVVSNDRGATWTAHPIAGSDASHLPYIAAVDATHPGGIYVRTSGTVPDTVPLASDSLLHSDDDGATFHELITNGARLLGFALAPDGETVLLGYGDPGDGAKVTGGLGVYRSPTSAFSFARVLEANVSCLSWTRSGVYVCAGRDQAKADLFFASDGDLGSDAGCLERRLRLDDVRGPVACGPTASACASSWSVTCQVFGACSDAGAPGDSGALPVCPPEPPVDPSTTDAASPGPDDASSPDASQGGDDEVRDLDAANEPRPAVDGEAGVASANEDGPSSCACAQAGRGTSAPSAAVALLLLATMWRRRR